MESEDGFGDWRIAAASRLDRDLPEAFPGGPSHKAGAAVYLSALVTTEQRQCWLFGAQRNRDVVQHRT